MPTQLTNLSNFADQTLVLQLPDGTTANLELIYQGASERWLMNISYASFTRNGLNICCYPNMLRQYKEILPFGLAFVTVDQTDPVDINDFSTGRVLVYLLDQSDIASIESDVFASA